MARSRRKTTGTKKGAAGAGNGAKAGTPAAASAAFATAHDFVDRPPAAAKSEAGSSRPKGEAGTAAAASAAETGRAGKAAPSESTERASVAASQEAAREADRAVTEQKEPVPGAAAAAARSDPTEDRAEAGADARPASDPYPHGTGDPDPAPGHGAAAYGASDHHDGLHPESDHDRPGAAAIALMALAGIIVVAVLTLWLAPKAAPYLPGSIARYLTPGQIAVEDRLGDLEARIATREAEAEQLLAAQPDLQTLEGQIEDIRAQLAAAGVPGAGADADARAGLEAAAGERAELVSRVESLETGLSG
ncbi:MAG TPA: hypothetical protein VMM55_04940, partial [Thermohalobaculum sp.]|nr:hypothetical protein [Thermohalobaculum sp.]